MVKTTTPEAGVMPAVTAGTTNSTTRVAGMAMPTSILDATKHVILDMTGTVTSKRHMMRELALPLAR